jgi:hypothetical protein
MKLTQIFKQRKTTLVNGEVVKFGDMVSFISSDGIEIKGSIRRRSDGTLYFHNNRWEISDYPTLKRVTPTR